MQASAQGWGCGRGGGGAEEGLGLGGGERVWQEEAAQQAGQWVRGEVGGQGWGVEWARGSIVGKLPHIAH